MSAYTHTLTCIIPAPLGAIGAAVGRALDPDIGGDHTFVPLDAQYDEAGDITKQPTKLWVSNCPVIAEVAASIPYLLASPEMLLATIERDFATRFQDVPVPTLAECAEFCAAAVVEVLP
jgi:hypothetical protein